MNRRTDRKSILVNFISDGGDPFVTIQPYTRNNMLGSVHVEFFREDNSWVIWQPTSTQFVGIQKIIGINDPETILDELNKGETDLATNIKIDEFNFQGEHFPGYIYDGNSGPPILKGGILKRKKSKTNKRNKTNKQRIRRNNITKKRKSKSKINKNTFVKYK
jgi:hypothetical protein